ncbi:hypothetical protein [Pseudomonas sp. CGJS7]|uniref:hypothetical protein n=1 Tax=Pseudomonas sp. CGJS7 TaxID=3109348 RepID=UPI00300A325F
MSTKSVLIQRSANISRFLSFVAFAFWGVAISMLALGWGTLFVPMLKLAILVGLVAVLFQGLVAIGYTWCVFSAIAFRPKKPSESVQAETRLLVSWGIAWLCFATLFLGASLMPYVLLRPWFFVVLLTGCVGQAIGIRLSRHQHLARTDASDGKPDGSSFLA